MRHIYFHTILNIFTYFWKYTFMSTFNLFDIFIYTCIRFSTWCLLTQLKFLFTNLFSHFLPWLHMMIEFFDSFVKYFYLLYFYNSLFLFCLINNYFRDIFYIYLILQHNVSRLRFFSTLFLFTCWILQFISFEPEFITWWSLGFTGSNLVPNTLKCSFTTYTL